MGLPRVPRNDSAHLARKLQECISDDTFKPFQDCDFQWLSAVFLSRPNHDADRKIDTLKTSSNLNTMPNINNLLPNDIIPSRIMADVNLANKYTTKTLRMSSHTKPKRKAASPESGTAKKRSKPTNESSNESDEDVICSPSRKTTDPSDKDDLYVPPGKINLSLPLRTLRHQRPTTTEVITKNNDV